MGFYPQPNDWACGPFALKHALVALGRMVDEDELAAVARTHWWSGTDETGLSRAARIFDCDLVHERSLNAEGARKLLINRLRQKMPVLLCVDGWEHWITAVRYESNRFVIIDSKLDPVLEGVSWQTLERRWRFLDTDYDEDEPPVIYDYLALQPRFRVRVKADFSLARLRHLRRPENRALSLHWDEYLEDLLEICRPRSQRSTGAQTLGEFLRRNQELIVSRVSYWHGDIERERIERVLGNFRFVAETYGLVIPAPLARQAVADFAILTTMTAVALGGLDDNLYGLKD